MEATEALLMTDEGWRRLHAELASLYAERGSLMSDYSQLSGSLDPSDAASQMLRSDIAHVDRRVAMIEEVLHRAVPVNRDKLKPGVVGVGSRVTLRWEDGESEQLLLVGPMEVEPATGRISYESPVGRAIMDRRQGDSVEVSTPNGVSRLQIESVE